MKPSKKDAIDLLWRRGELSWKLDANQKELLHLYQTSTHKIHVWNLARRTGKSYALIVFALMILLAKDHTIVKYVAPTKTQLKDIIRPLIREILLDCPSELRPTYSAKDYIYYFPNGSELQLAGSENGHARKLRGGNCHLAIIDEGQDVTELSEVIKGDLLPTTLTTKGKLLIAGTSPKNPNHEFVTWIQNAEMDGTLVKKTIYDNPRLTKEDIEEMERSMGGKDSEEFRRECLCEVIRSKETTVFPEFDEKLQSDLVKVWPTPPYKHFYVAMDLGFTDLTAVLFGYYDYRGGKYVIEDELLYDFKEKDQDIKKLTDKILAKEEELFKNPVTLEIQKPRKRVSDINHIVTNEIHMQSGKKLRFEIPDKDDKEVMVSKVRLSLRNKEIIIHPKCKNLITHMKYARWYSPNNHSEFARSEDHGHYDFCDALIYFIRSIDVKHNPYPAGYDYSNINDLQIQNYDQFYKSDLNNVLHKLFGKRPKIK